MWAQMISMRLVDGAEAKLPALFEKLQAIEQPGSGFVRSTALRDDNDPSRVAVLVMFESEEAARARENDPRREAGLQDVRALMAEMFAGPPEFTDFTVLNES